VPRDDAVSRQSVIGQAVYTWAQKLYTGNQGEGFVAASLALTSDMKWLEASSRPLIGHVGNKHRVTPAQRGSYKPLGRHLHVDRVHGGRTFVYHKTNVESDLLDRAGNYLIHFLVAPAVLIGMSDTLRIQDSFWVYDVPGIRNDNSGKLRKLPDIQVSGFRDQLNPSVAVQASDVSMIVRSAMELTQRRVLDIARWQLDDVLVLLSTLPPWVDYATELISEWTETGPTRRLKLTEITLSGAPQDRRCSLMDDELLSWSERLKGAKNLRDLEELLSAGTSRSAEEKVGAGQGHPSQSALSLEQSVLKWSAQNEKLNADEISTILGAEPRDVLLTLDLLCRRIPSRQDRANITVSLLGRCNDVDPRALSRVMPIEDQSVSQFVTLCPNSMALEAAVLINSNPLRRVELKFPDGISPSTLVRLLRQCVAEEEFHEGLVRSVRISCQGESSFVRPLLRSPGMDLNYLYERVLPSAAGRADLLWMLMSINPEGLISWSQFPEQYCDAFIVGLRRAQNDAPPKGVAALIDKRRRRQQ
jgi:hypothetical protein